MLRLSATKNLTVGDTVKCEEPGPSQALLTRESMEEMGAVLELLDERSRYIIEARFGFFGPPQTLERLGRQVQDHPGAHPPA